MRSSPWRGSRRAWRGRALMRVKGPVEEIALGKRSRRRRLHENRERFGKLSLARRSITVETRCFDNLDLYKCPWPSPGAHARLEVSIPPHEGTKDEAASEKICAGRSGEGMCASSLSCGDYTLKRHVFVARAGGRCGHRCVNRKSLVPKGLQRPPWRSVEDWFHNGGGPKCDSVRSHKMLIHKVLRRQSAGRQGFWL